MSSLSKDDILNIGTLARLHIEADELEGLKNHFDAELGYFEILKELDLSAVRLEDFTEGQTLRLEADEPLSNDLREAILNEAPNRHGDFIRVPRIGGGE